MDSSKLPQGQGSDECSSNESGWTAYIASPDREEEDHDDDDDDQDQDQDRGKDEEQREEEDARSDDSMASDASSGPSNQFRHFNKQFGYKHAKNTNETIHGGKKEQKHGDKKQQHDEKMKAAKDKAGSATRSRKK